MASQDKLFDKINIDNMKFCYLSQQPGGSTNCSGFELLSKAASNLPMNFGAGCKYLLLRRVNRPWPQGRGCPIANKRAQRALERSPEKKVKGHSGANYRGPLI